MKNSKKSPKKISNIMKKMNYMLYTVFCMQFIIICIFASLSMIWMRSNPKLLKFLDMQVSMAFSSWLIQLLTFWVAYSHLIPISLYVIIEMLKLTQSYLIGKDV
jgi:magnesium-transporting ATPase (P-type)